MEYSWGHFLKFSIGLIILVPGIWNMRGNNVDYYSDLFSILTFIWLAIPFSLKFLLYIMWSAKASMVSNSNANRPLLTQIDSLICCKDGKIHIHETQLCGQFRRLTHSKQVKWKSQSRTRHNEEHGAAAKAATLCQVVPITHTHTHPWHVVMESCEM